MTKFFNFFAPFFVITLAMVIMTASNSLVLAADTATSAPQALAANQANSVMIDDFESGAITNSLGGKTNVFVKAPSKAMVSFRKDVRNGRPTNVMMLKYDKQSEGGPYDLGGWCGYYTMLKKNKPSASVAGGSAADIEEDAYFDASHNSAITMWVKGDKGNENFIIGLADAHWDKVGDSMKSQEIGKYLPAGKITTDWQKAVIPLDEFFVDYSKLSSVSVSFESDCFPEGAGSGVLYLDDISLE